MTSIYDRPETLAGVQTPEYAALMFTWAGDTLTDLPNYFDLTDDEFAALSARAEAHAEGATLTAGPAFRPTCESCGVELLALRSHTPEQAWCGMWWGHPYDRLSLIGHTVSAVYPAPHEHAALAAQAHVR